MGKIFTKFYSDASAQGAAYLQQRYGGVFLQCEAKGHIMHGVKESRVPDEQTAMECVWFHLSRNIEFPENVAIDVFEREGVYIVDVWQPET